MRYVLTTRARALAILTAIALFTLPAFAQDQEGPPPYPAPPLDPGALTGDEMRLFAHALSSIMLNIDDLRFKKDYYDDPFRLETVQRALDEPLSLVEWNYGWDAFLLEPKATADIIGKAAQDLDCGELQSFEYSPEKAKPAKRPKGIPQDWHEMIMSLDEAIFKASALIEGRVMGSLTEEDRAFLKTYLICRFIMEDKEQKIEGIVCPQEEAYGANQQFLDTMENYDLASLLAIAAQLSSRVEKTIEMMRTLKRAVAIRGRAGAILIGTKGDDTWRLDEQTAPCLIIDPGGNDVYYGGIAAAGNLKDENNPLVSVVIDLKGHDMYLSQGERSNGSGVLGVAMQFDLEGNDTYRAGKLSQGCGLYGVGILSDREGDDLYRADFLVQGKGILAGIGKARVAQQV
ncbi:hypothetical protein ACFLU6_16605, partial [Acidobacteriota bacterium]